MAQETETKVDLFDAPAAAKKAKAKKNGKSNAWLDAAKADKAKAKGERKVGTEAKRAAKRPSKAEVIKSSKATKPAKKSKAGGAPRTGEFTAHVEAAMAKLKSLKAGTKKTTMELSEQYEIPSWAFRVAAGRMDEVKLHNADRVNTITRR